MKNIVKQLKFKIRERQVLLEEKDTIPAIQVFRHRELAQKIAAMTEDIVELKSEKVLLLHQFGCLDAKDMEAVKQKVSSMKVSLQKLDRQEAKCADELDAALAQFNELRRQAADMDAAELDAARQAIHPDKEREAAQRLQVTYQRKFDSRLLIQSRKDVADLLDEVAEPVSIREKLHQPVEQAGRQHHTNRRDWER